MIWTNIQDIPYQFICDAALSISKRYEIKSVRMDPQGELCIKCSDKLLDNQIKGILEEITPGGLPKDYIVKCDIDYDQTETDLGWMTYIYTLGGIDYRTIMHILEERKYHSIKDIPYAFLRNALLFLVNRYLITDVTICEDGGLIMDIKGCLSEKEVKYICFKLCPKGISFEETFKNVESMYENYKETNVDYTTMTIPKNIDYTKL